jgi:hypothetical protein
MKAALFLILTMLSFSAPAAWTEVTISTEGDIHYVDFVTLKKEGSTRSFWRLINYGRPLSRSRLSARSKVVIDCQQETLDMVSLDFFAQYGARGAPENIQPDRVLVYAAPNTISAIIMRSVCSK